MCEKMCTTNCDEINNNARVAAKSFFAYILTLLCYLREMKITVWRNEMSKCKAHTHNQFIQFIFSSHFFYISQFFTFDSISDIQFRFFSFSSRPIIIIWTAFCCSEKWEWKLADIVMWWSNFVSFSLYANGVCGATMNHNNHKIN